MRRKTPEKILLRGRPKPCNLKQLLLEIGRRYVCAECGQEPVHNGKPLTLPVDHIDGDNTNQLPENLRFLCPNCHAQTPTYGWKNRKTHGRKKCEKV